MPLNVTRADGGITCRGARASIVLAAVLSTVALPIACGSPIAPDPRGPTVAFSVTCAPAGFDVACLALRLETGPNAGPARDVTQDTQWTVSNPAVAEITAPGRIHAIGEGGTRIRGKYASGMEMDHFFYVSPGQVPEPMLQLSVVVRDGAQVLQSIDQAHVEMVPSRGIRQTCISPCTFAVLRSDVRIIVTASGFFPAETTASPAASGFAPVTVALQRRPDPDGTETPLPIDGQMTLIERFGAVDMTPIATNVALGSTMDGCGSTIDGCRNRLRMRFRLRSESSGAVAGIRWYLHATNRTCLWGITRPFALEAGAAREVDVQFELPDQCPLPATITTLDAVLDGPVPIGSRLVWQLHYIFSP